MKKIDVDQIVGIIGKEKADSLFLNPEWIKKQRENYVVTDILYNVYERFGRLESLGGDEYKGDFVFIHRSPGLTKFLPKIKKLHGDFMCYSNNLASLVGCPDEVTGNFNCYDNMLETLEGSPRIVGGSFDCTSNKLVDLKGSPDFVGGNFACIGNKLTSIDGIPKAIKGKFFSDLKTEKKLFGKTYQLVKNTISESQSNYDLELKTVEDTNYVYAKIDGKTVGTLVFFKSKFKPVLVAGSVSVDPNYRRQGIASAMYNFAENKFKLKFSNNDEVLTPDGKLFRDGKTCKQIEKNVDLIESSSATIKLYRGMTQEIDHKYNLNKFHKSDSPTNYSYWTDNLKLAREYSGTDGYVYKIELPLKYIGNDIFDEDGDRVLFFKNKKLSLRGIFGNEYLVYDKHELFDDFPISQI